MQQRAPFIPANSPPLHHPVPQHVSTVPQLRSPPPPLAQGQQPQMNSYGNPYQLQPQQGGMGGYGAGFEGFISDPTAQMGFQIGKHAMDAGQHYIDQNINRFVSVTALKHYFNVSNTYVLHKLALVLVPWRHKPWSRQQARLTTSSTNADGTVSQQQFSAMYLPPRDDLNSPDMYIPIMALITYILLYTISAGIKGSFNPEDLGSTAGSALGLIGCEIGLLYVAMYFLGIKNSSQLLDLVAYSGYKFVGVIVTKLLAEIFTRGGGTGTTVGWVVFTYTYFANAFFLLRSLKYVLLPDSSSDTAMRSGETYTVARAQRNRRTQFLFGYAYIVQLVLMWVFSRDEAASKTVASRLSGS